MASCQVEDEKEGIQKQLDEVDVTLANECEERNRQKVFDNFGDITGTKGNVSNNGIWKVNKKIFPKNITAVPTAKKDVNGMLVSNPDLLKKLHLDTYHTGKTQANPTRSGADENTEGGFVSAQT